MTIHSHDIHQQLTAYLQPNLASYLDLLRQMVSINSYTANAAGVNAVGDLTAAAFADLGFTVEKVPSANPAYGCHLVLTRPARSSPADAPQIGLVSHLDTVFPPEEEAANDFSWRREGDRCYGPGTVDCKGGTAGIYMTLAALQAVAPQAYDAVTWVVLVDASEERDAFDFQDLCLRRLAGNTLACLIYEGGFTENGAYTAVVARKGMAVYHVTVEGRGAHAGSAHEEGANAIVQLADTIGRIAALTDYGHELTFNVGRVAGGTVTNRVPHRPRPGSRCAPSRPTSLNMASSRCWPWPASRRCAAPTAALPAGCASTSSSRPHPGRATRPPSASWPCGSRPAPPWARRWRPRSGAA